MTRLRTPLGTAFTRKLNSQLGKASMSDLGEYGKAIHYVKGRGAAPRRAARPTTKPSASSSRRDSRNTFTANSSCAALCRHKSVPGGGGACQFYIGMPSSGSTLSRQITLSSHPQFRGGVNQGNSKPAASLGLRSRFPVTCRIIRGTV